MPRRPPPLRPPRPHCRVPRDWCRCCCRPTRCPHCRDPALTDRRHHHISRGIHVIDPDTADQHRGHDAGGAGQRSRRR
ncbi:hypothetical protein C1S82_31580 [Mycolicibacterium cosmeticum]|nr:hypothetical protein C1S82_31580 [Mycolicibacterium cosmeticum]